MSGLPASTPELQLIAVLASALEKHIPGISQEMLEQLDNDELYDNVISIRPIGEQAKIRESRAYARAWMRTTKVIGRAVGRWGPRKRRKA